MKCFQLSSVYRFSAGEDKTWAPLLDRVHGPLIWTRSMDPLFTYLEKKHKIKNKAVLKAVLQLTYAAIRTQHYSYTNKLFPHVVCLALK